MNNHRFKLWTEQSYVIIPSMFFKYYKQIGITDEQALCLLHVIPLLNGKLQGVVSLGEIASRTRYERDELLETFDTLANQNYIELIDVPYEPPNETLLNIDIELLWQRILQFAEEVELIKLLPVPTETKLKKQVRKVFNRPLTKQELETINKWLHEEMHSPLLIQFVLHEAVLANKNNIHYMQRVLFAWEAANTYDKSEPFEYQLVRFREFLEKRSRKFKPQFPFRKPEVYNWLNEDN